MSKGAEEACASLGFAHAVVFRMADDQLLPSAAHAAPPAAVDLLATFRHEPLELAQLPLEAELRRRRIAVLADPADRRLSPAFADAWPHGYVAAPLAPEGRVIGALHAAHADRAPTAADRDALAAYAEGLAYALAAALLGERLHAQRRQVQGMLATTEHLVDELLGADVTLPDLGAPRRGIPGPDVFGDQPRDAASERLRRLLTARELEVIRLLAAGETTSGVASRLVITEGTVKSHVKHILRKLSASNRAEAVARYLRLAAGEELPS